MNRLWAVLLVIIAACGLFLPTQPPAVVHASPPVLCIVFVPDHQFLTATGGAAASAMQKEATWITTSVASTFGCSVEAVVGEGDQMNTVCNTVSGTREDLQIYTQLWSIITTAGFRWSVAAGNHEYIGGIRNAANLSENFKDAPSTPACSASIPTPGQFSPAGFVARNLGFTSTSQFWGQAAGHNQNSYLRWTPSGYHAMTVVTVDFFADQTELDAAGVQINAHPNDDVIVVTHAAMAATDNINHVAQYFDYTCANPPFYCNSPYGLDATNSRSGLAIRDWAKGFRNIQAVVNGHYFPTPTTADGHWSTRTDAATDGHQIIGIHADWQDLDQNPNVAFTGGGGTCPAIGSTGCTAEVGYVMTMVIDTGAHTATLYALSTNTGHWVVTGTALASSTTMTPLTSFTYNGTTHQGVFPMPTPLSH